MPYTQGMTQKKKLPTWLVIVRFGVLVGFAGIVVYVAGSLASSLAIINIAIWVTVIGLAIAVGGVILRLAQGSTRV